MKCVTTVLLQHGFTLKNTTAEVVRAQTERVTGRFRRARAGVRPDSQRGARGL